MQDRRREKLPPRSVHTLQKMNLQVHQPHKVDRGAAWLWVKAILDQIDLAMNIDVEQTVIKMSFTATVYKYFRGRLNSPGIFSLLFYAFQFLNVLAYVVLIVCWLKPV